MNMFQQLTWGEAKKQYSHNIVDCFTMPNSYVNVQLHNIVEYLSAMETINTIGTNDTWNTSGYDAATYENSLRTMATGLIEKYGTETKIVLLYGMMTDKNADEVNRVAETLSGQGYAVSAKQLSGNSWGHPRVSHNEVAGEELTQYLQTLLS